MATKCHAADAACLKRQRAERKASAVADHARRAEEFSKTGDKKAFYQDREPTTFAKGELKDLTGETPLPKVGGGINITQKTEDKTDMSSNARSMFTKKMGY